MEEGNSAVALAVTVGTNPVPVLLTVCQHRPHTVWLVHTTGPRGTADYARRVAAVLGGWFPALTVHLLDVGADAADVTAIRAALRPLAGLPAGWACDYTGGTAVMSVLLAQTHRDAHLAVTGADRPDLRGYWDESGDRVHHDDGTTRRCAVPEGFTLDTIRRLHGYLSAPGPTPCSPALERGPCYARDLCRLAHAVLTGQQPPEVPVDQRDRELIGALLGSGDAAGAALELVVGALLTAAPLVLSRIPAPDEVHLNTKAITAAAPSSGDANELDVLARYGQRVVAISCKNRRNPQGILASALGEINQKARAVYGGATRPALTIIMDKAGESGGPHPAPDELSTLLLGPGMTLRGPHIITEADLRDLLAEVIGLRVGQPRLRPLLAQRFGLVSVAAVVPPAELPTGLDGPVLITTLSGNVLATVASAHRQRPRHVIVLGTPEFRDRVRATDLDAALGAPGATTRFVPIAMTALPALTRTIGALIAGVRGPVVVDVTGGTKTVSVAGYLAVAAASEAGRGDLRLCYTDIWSGSRRWFDGTTEPLGPMDDRIGQLLVAHASRPEAVSFRAVDPAALDVSGEKSPSRVLLARVMARLAALLPTARWYRPTLTLPGRAQDWNWLPPGYLLVTGNRLIGLYGHERLGKSADGLSEALFVDTLVAALGGDIARTLLVTDRDSPDAAYLSARYSQLVRRPFPPRVLTREHAEIVLTSADAAHELLDWLSR
ncbi:hypothetical protein [Kutzneria buriramensis]|uniref:hypothetical protein n=1 Tax=Kutzneria buriramensis TaxID=1045776 RepID=UPI000E284166|nr:hypothetical protein [Kutzneria buriramensis]